MGSFLYDKGNKPHHDRRFLLAQKTSPISFTSEQIFFEMANRKLTDLTSCLLAFSGKRNSEEKWFLEGCVEHILRQNTLKAWYSAQCSVVCLFNHDHYRRHQNLHLIPNPSEYAPNFHYHVELSVRLCFVYTISVIQRYLTCRCRATGRWQAWERRVFVIWTIRQILLQ